MRLFAGLPIPDDVAAGIEATLAPCRTEHPELRWTGRGLWHVTLAFYGEVDDAAYERLLPRLARVAARHPGPNLSVGSAGAFPRAANARALWLGIGGDRRGIARLAASAAAAGRRVGLATGETRAYRPHLTIARCRRPADLRPLVEMLAPYSGRAWTADGLHLVRSHLGPAVRHETVQAWPLTVTA